MNLYKESFGLLKKDKSRTIAIMVVEFIFILVLFLVSIYTYSGVLEKYDLLETLGSRLNVAETESAMFQTESNLILLNDVLNKMFFSVFYFALFILVFSSLVLGLTSVYCARFIREKKLNWGYFGKFLTLSLMWFVVFLFLFLINGIFSGQIGAYILGVLLLIMSYFVMVSVSMFLLRNNLKEGIKAVYKVGIKRFRKGFPHYLLGVAILLGISGLFTYLSEIYEILALIGIIVFLFLFVWFRVLFLKLLE